MTVEVVAVRTTTYQEGDVVIFTNEHDADDPSNGSHVVVHQSNPAALIYGDTEHYSVFVPGIFGYSYAKATELRPMREIKNGNQ